MRRLRLLLVIGALSFSMVGSCGRSQRPLDERLQTALDVRLRHYDVKGASVAVILPDGTIWRGASGVSHPGVNMSPDMAFAIGSITKNMVAALMLQLAEEGKLSLDEPIGQWLPSYPHVNPAITIRQMLNHTSGLFMFWDNQQLWDDLVRYRTKHFTPEGGNETVSGTFSMLNDGRPAEGTDGRGGVGWGGAACGRDSFEF